MKVAEGQVRRVGWVGGDSNVVFGQEFPGEKKVRDGVLL
jgi:hypothetical protein